MISLQHFGSVEKLMDAKYEEVESIYGVGPVVAQAVVDWFKEGDNRKLVKNLLKHLEIEKVQVGNKLAGKSFVFTGTLPTLEREDAQEMVRKAGGEVSSSVSKNTTYLVAGESVLDQNLIRHGDLGVTILTEEEFLKCSNNATLIL
jgi:DNA ligase (NAD+)